MTAHLLAMELGPVVQIIAAARKTRDMYFGSWMLSEIAKAAARQAATICGPAGMEHESLIAPAPVNMEELNDPRFAMGDEILIEVPAGIAPAEVAQAARQAAHDRWLAFANDARGQVLLEEKRSGKNLLRDEPGETWWQQVAKLHAEELADEVVEVVAAWVPLTIPYQDCLSELKRLLLGRNGCRNFPAVGGVEGLPKSSLDGRRETVIVDSVDRNTPIRSRKLRLSGGEQLDALGVTKRAGDGAKNFPSTARLAADPWVRGASADGNPRFAALVAECEKLARPDRDNDPILGRVQTGKASYPSYPSFDKFPYEGTILYETRHHEFIEETDVGEDILVDLSKALHGVIKEHREPRSYYAALVADGDNVGNHLRNCSDAAEHRRFSLRLSAFAAEVREIVSDPHHGVLIFAAGEDISALLPVDKAIECADALRQRFLKDINVGGSDAAATLSVGIAIGHFLDPLEDTLEAARKMESHAKRHPGKNALAVQYLSRGGAPIQFRSSWLHDPLKRISDWAALLDSGDLPDKVAYDVRRAAEFYRRWPSDSKDDVALLQRAMKADLLRLLSKKRKEARIAITPLLETLGSPDDVVALANTIIIAGQIQKAKRQSQSGGKA